MANSNEIIETEIIDKEGNVQKVPITPAEYFESIKNKMENETKENLMNLYKVALKNLKKFMITGQTPAAKLVYSKCKALEKEVELMDHGITTFINRDIIDKYIDDVADDCVVVIELRNYERNIPDDIIDKVADTKEIFDDFYIVFTDYTGEKRAKVAKERRDKDPILFGNIFEDGKPSKKMYFIGDWVDEYCDLTLDKMMNALKESGYADDVDHIVDFSDLDAIEKELFKKPEQKPERREKYFENGAEKAAKGFYKYICQLYCGCAERKIIKRRADNFAENKVKADFALVYCKNEEKRGKPEKKKIENIKNNNGGFGSCERQAHGS